MNLSEYYTNLYNSSIDKIKADQYQPDSLITSPEDTRRGITLLIRPDETVKNRITEFLNKVKSVAPNQYFYPASDMHITIMSIISGYEGFNLSQINPTDYIPVIEESIKNIKPFEINFKGITASPNCVMIQGFDPDNALNQIRDRLRNNFRDSNLQQSMDKRYAIQTAHSTVIRLKEPLINKTSYISLLNNYREHYFGTFTVNKLEFVFNDWYQRRESVKRLHTFHLPG